MQEITKRVAEVFRKHFGRTSLRERLNDILNEAIELKSAQDITSMRDEAGDTLCSLLALCAESGWDPEELIGNTLQKIERRQAQYAALGRKTKVGILGGSFNPVTTGHVRMGNLALQTAGLDEVWFMPTYDHMYGKDLAPAEVRMEMLHAALAEQPMLRPFDYEIRHQMKGRMLHVMNRLLDDAEYRDTHSFCLVVGMDVAVDVENWEGGLRITDVLPFVVLDRAGSEQRIRPNVWFMQPPHKYIADEKREIPAVSSTMAREAIAAGREAELRDVILPAVLEIIRREGLYGAK